jgi:hypothetical protein
MEMCSLTNKLNLAAARKLVIYIKCFEKNFLVVEFLYFIIILEMNKVFSIRNEEDESEDSNLDSKSEDKAQEVKYLNLF